MFKVILIETLSTCTRACNFCAWGQDRKPAKKLMDCGLIEKIAKQLEGMDFDGRISLFHINEPLLDVRLPIIIQLFRDACPQSFITINTNGDLMHESYLYTLSLSGLDAIGWSIYDDAMMAKAQAFTDTEHVKIQILDQRQRKGFENRAGSLERIGQPNNNICYRPSYMIVVKADGTVPLCCSDMYGDYPMGNANTQPLATIWNSEAFEKYRQQLMRGRKGLNPCQNCSYSGKAPSARYPLDLI